MPDSVSASLRDSFSLPTWLAAAALCQCLILALVPLRFAIVPSLALITIRLVPSLIACSGLIPDSSLNQVHFGRWTSKIPSRDGQVAEKPASKRVTVLVLGARSHHPAGPLAPDLVDIAANMQELTAELDKDAKKWGFLGRTPALVSSEAASSNTLVWMLYWESAEALHYYANSSKHVDLMKWYMERSKATGYHIGVMHEMYDVPASHWETIYLNMRPFGLGNCTFPIEMVDENGAKQDSRVSGLYPAKGANWRTMMGRLGRVEPGKPVL